MSLTITFTFTTVKIIKLPPSVRSLSLPPSKFPPSWDVYDITNDNLLGMIVWDTYKNEYRFIARNARRISFSEVSLQEIAGFMTKLREEQRGA